MSMTRNMKIAYFMQMTKEHGVEKVIVFLLDLIEELKAKGQTAVLAQDGDDGLDEWYQK